MPIKNHLSTTWMQLNDVVSFCSFRCDWLLCCSRARRFLRTLTVFDSCIVTSSSESQLASMMISLGSTASFVPPAFDVLACGLRFTFRLACPCRAV